MTVEFSCIQPSGGDEETALSDSSDFTVSVGNKDGSGLLFYCSTTSEDDGARFCIGQVQAASQTASQEESTRAAEAGLNSHDSARPPGLS